MHDASVLDADTLDRFRRAAAGAGVPEAWTKSQAFSDNVIHLLTALGKNAPVVSLAVGVTSSPWIRRLLLGLSTRSASVGSMLVANSIPLLAAFDQKLAHLEPPELYEPMKDFVAAFVPEPLDLTEARFADRFFFEHERSPGEVDQAAIDRALDFIPDVVAIGSGPACATALNAFWSRRPKAAALVLDLGDYYTQAQYLEHSPGSLAFDTFKDGGSPFIVNGPNRVTMNFSPQVWGGGAEIFSGTAHALPEWYKAMMPLAPAVIAQNEARIRHDCRISTTPFDILNDGQKKFFAGAESLGKNPYLLEGFGRGGDRGEGRCYAGKKERIPYLDNFFRRGEDVRGIANCRVDRIVRDDGGGVAALELSFVSRVTRKVIAERRIALPSRCRVLLAAGSLGDQRLLARSGDAVSLSLRSGVLHGYTSEVLGLFAEPMASNGIPQGIGLQVLPDEIGARGQVTRRATLEGAHPGRPTLAALGMNNAGDRLAAWRATPRVGTVGVLFTESKAGVQLNAAHDVTLQHLSAKDFARMNTTLAVGMDCWLAAGAQGVTLNTPVRFVSKHPHLAALGFAGRDEVDTFKAFCAKHPPLMQVFYRTGHRFGTVDKSTGEIPGFSRVHLVGEDAIPPGPGVNPTLGIMILSHAYGEAAADAQSHK